LSLLELQRRMAADVRRPLTPDFDMQTVSEDGQSTATMASRYIKPSATLTSLERLAIYNRQYWFRVLDALSEDYPALSAIVGPDRFDALIRAYLADNPSTSFTLRISASACPPGSPGIRSSRADATISPWMQLVWSGPMSRLSMGPVCLP
jgi:hypothetical protein